MWVLLHKHWRFALGTASVGPLPQAWQQFHTSCQERVPNNPAHIAHYYNPRFKCSSPHPFAGSNNWERLSVAQTISQTRPIAAYKKQPSNRRRSQRPEQQNDRPTHTPTLTHTQRPLSLMGCLFAYLGTHCTVAPLQQQHSIYIYNPSFVKVLLTINENK